MRREIAQQFHRAIAAEIAESERANDIGLISNLKLSASMLEARIKLGMNICIRHDLVERTGEMIAADLARRGELIRLHAELAELGKRMGLDVTATGDGGDKDENDIFFPVSAVANDQERRRA